MGEGILSIKASSFRQYDYHTEVVETPIDEIVPGMNGKILVLTSLDYLAGSSDHTMSVMFAEGAGSRNTNGTAVAISGQKEIVVTDAPKDPSGNATESGDIIAFQLTDNSWEFDTVASLSTKTITLTNNITGVDAEGGATAIAIGAKVLIFGVETDNKSFKLTLEALTPTGFDDSLGVIHPYAGEPFYVSIDNVGTGTGGELNYMIFAYLPE